VALSLVFSRWWRPRWAMFSVSLQDSLAYRAVALIWMLTDTVPAVLMPLVWLASYNGRATIGGFTPSNIVVYYLAMLALSNLMVTHIMWDMNRDIAEGRLSIFLTRPFPYIQFCYLGNISWRLMRMMLFVPLALVFVLFFRRYLAWESYYLGPLVWLAILVGHLLSFVIGYALGLLSLFFVEARNLYNFYYMPLVIFSGELAPLALLPGVLQRLAGWMPWRYTLSFPIELFLGRVSGAAVAEGFAVACGWMVFFYLLSRVLWRTGLRHYTGVGM
jgi:ABC-2 type transport system permease protein